MRAGKGRATSSFTERKSKRGPRWTRAVGARSGCRHTGCSSSNLKFRPPIVAYLGIIGSVQPDEFQFFLSDLNIRCSIGFPQNLFTDRKTAPFFRREIGSNEAIIRTAEIVDAPGEIFADIDLSVGIYDLVDNLHQAGVFSRGARFIWCHFPRTAVV